MGYSSWSDDTHRTITADYKTKSTDDIFTSNKTNNMDSEMSPNGVDIRESRDSEDHPESLAVGVFLDVTASMGHIPEKMVREKLGPLMNTLMTHGIDHPQILFGAIGDHHSDRCPLQVGQFESGTEELDKWLSAIYLESGGGGQDMESYLLAWNFMARHTSIDCFEKRNQKGFLFTIGDEWTWDEVSADRLKEIMGYAQADNITHTQVLAEAQRAYHVFHIHANEGNYRDDPTVIGKWKKLLGERLLIVDDYTAIAELIASTVAVVHGIDLKTITAGMDSDIAGHVTKALSGVTALALADDKEGVLKV